MGIYSAGNAALVPYVSETVNFNGYITDDVNSNDKSKMQLSNTFNAPWDQPNNYALTGSSQASITVKQSVVSNDNRGESVYAKNGNSWINIGQMSNTGASTTFDLSSTNFGLLFDDMKNGLQIKSVWINQNNNDKQATATSVSYNLTGINNVPIPAAAWLLGTGLIGLVAIRRRRK